VIRYPYRNGDLKARGPVEVIVPDIPGWASCEAEVTGRATLSFSADGKKMFVSVGSHSNALRIRKRMRIGARLFCNTIRTVNRARIRVGDSQRSRNCHPSADWNSSGLQLMSATGSATISFPTTSRALRREASMAGPGIISGQIRTAASGCASRVARSGDRSRSAFAIAFRFASRWFFLHREAISPSVH